MNHVKTRRDAASHKVTAFLLSLIGIALFFTAWVSDDALIAFRSAVNAIDGFGLRWNVQERVQSFTSPAWLLVITISYGITRDLFIVPLLLNIVLTLWCCALIVGRLAFFPPRQFFVVLLILFSNSFVDFSTSGLETSLLHLLLCLFFLRCGTPLSTTAHFLYGVTLASLIVLTRHDAVIIVAPCALVWFGSYGIKAFRTHGWSSVLSFSAMLPLGRSHLYFGVPFRIFTMAQLYRTRPMRS